MKQPTTQTIYDLFNGKIQFQIPVYQRAYVWNEDENWSVLWDDIVDTADRYARGSHGNEGHFLGPVVLEQQHFEPGGVDLRLVIDGQQRLTTMQVLLAAAVSVARDLEDEGEIKEFEELIANRGKAAVGDLRMKVRPSRRDRGPFKHLILGSEFEGAHALVDAFEFFRSRIQEWVADADHDGPTPLERLELLRVCIADLLYVVSINLDQGDNAQVIFETLNARGTGLGALDLVKNATFLHAQREGAQTDGLHDSHWEPTFEADDYWTEETRQGRQKRDRADWFLMHWLGMELGEVVRVDKLFDTFRREILRGEGRGGMDELITVLCRDARTMRSFDDFEPGTQEALFFSRLDALDTTTLMPIALLLFRSPEIPEDRRRRAIAALESWLVRRAILRLTSKNYNRTLTSVIKAIRDDLKRADEAIIGELRSSSAETAVWPDDAVVLDRLLTRPIYGYITQARVRMLLEACELDLRDSPKTEPVDLPTGLSIEHAMPLAWRENWYLDPTDEAALERRDSYIHRLGNLTLVTQPLNSSLSNAPWLKVASAGASKRAELQKRSVLLINQELCLHDRWDEEQIDARGSDLAARVLKTWPGPDAPAWGVGRTQPNMADPVDGGDHLGMSGFE